MWPLIDPKGPRLMKAARASKNATKLYKSSGKKPIIKHHFFAFRMTWTLPWISTPPTFRPLPLQNPSQSKALKIICHQSFAKCWKHKPGGKRTRGQSNSNERSATAISKSLTSATSSQNLKRKENALNTLYLKKVNLLASSLEDFCCPNTSSQNLQKITFGCQIRRNGLPALQPFQNASTEICSLIDNLKLLLKSRVLFLCSTINYMIKLLLSQSIT